MTMEEFISSINANTKLTESGLGARIISNYQQYQDATRPYDGKSKKAVLDLSSNKREHLADSVFSLKDVCNNLLVVIKDLVNEKEDDTVKKLSDLFESSFKKLSDELVSNVEKSLVTVKASSPPNIVENTPVIETPEKHVMFVENKDSENPSFGKEGWNIVCRRNLKTSLKNVPVLKTKLSKEGKGCVFFPDKEAMQQAKSALENDFTVTTDSKLKRSVMPKIKVFNVDTQRYNNKEVLQQSILEKNDQLNSLVQSGKVLEVVHIDSKFNNAILKCSPEIRVLINKTGKLFIGLQVHQARDHFSPMQCYSCQGYGHKQGSPECCKKDGGSTCLYCAGNHASKDCRWKGVQNRYACINCINSSNPTHRANSCHTSNSLCCPFMIKETNALIQRTAGLTEQEAKKFLLQAVY